MDFLVNHFHGPVKRRFEETFYLEENFEELGREEKQLLNKKARIESKINEDTVTRRPAPETSQWLDDVQRFETEQKTLCDKIGEYKRLPRKWIRFPQRVRLGWRIATQRNEIARLKEEAKFEDGVTVDAPPQTVEPISAPPMRSGTSTERTVLKILECLTNERFWKIGVWGTKGVGKTTVVKMLNNLPEIRNMFEIVIWVTVSNDGDVRQIQNQIAGRLNLELNPCNNGEEFYGGTVRRQILRKLENEKWLLILDDMSKKIDLEAVGIPTYNRGNGSKIVLTTESQNVCNKMETDEEIEVGVLANEESWELFREVVADEVVDSPEIESIARQIVEKCRGLPLTIKETGRYLRKQRNTQVWRNALNELDSA
ncbi:PREDICTED: disease resistance protein At4g27190-like [Nelumbo nucifera]|uniref:Disease resistance protein At4g27190-like n=2 Tax=Nelumbo nucifera TaxID=4432 RepID=A0A1U8A4K3_NELNU|nr:PREDICTED: disease resistance protein At4g27190-like [Nelumbo nucifera]XP_010259767.1 PREDICTED: disease resistance protein At4g27190-like [Nelumbo nucifera]DAD27640.1 TPA_asm: hypothetical protein HUJ06_029108 [Nelumbo nucifera]